MSTPQRLNRQRQQVAELEAAALRALTGDRELHYRGQRPQRGMQPLALNAPHLKLATGNIELAALRGVTDALAMRLQYSKPALHRHWCPEPPVERLIFELLEQLRTESLVSGTMPGMATNMRLRFEAWCREFHRSGLTESALGILLYSVAQICWSRLMARSVLEETEDVIEATRAAIAPAIGTALAGLRRYRHDQAAYAPYALEIAQWVGASVENAMAERAEDDEAADRVQQRFALLLDFEDETQDSFTTATTGDSKHFAQAQQRYHIYTTAHDSVVPVDSQVRDALLAEYRDHLDARIATQGVNLRRLARLFSARLSTPRRDGWHFGEEAGVIDGRRLAQLVSSPTERRLFQRERYRPRANCLVSFLVDCSGSMKMHGEPVAMLLDQLSRALEMAGVTTEVLGFTTGAWNGGRPYQTWLSRGRPASPGRLNEVRYLVFKDADTPWRRARRNIGALLKHDIYREGIDGEAVEWACARMTGRDETRRQLIVISDGCPMDSATGLANDKFYLDNHLKEVVARQERLGEVGIAGIGVGLDLSPFYRHNLPVDLSQGLDNELLMNIAGLIINGCTYRR
ncbi:cobaltochelatase CobT-related protein [Billgrantia endophytica]|uniref:Cobalt chelatase n=1 Tax=Billgrantia endophytica TaxID=2033802 RepID=A0A2N7TW94_9GAMM|nr:cobalt chelatase [Halomonas endophytica]PMR72460.1 cobalt chelatase [Halomonas endophytica]